MLRLQHQMDSRKNTQLGKQLGTFLGWSTVVVSALAWADPGLALVPPWLRYANEVKAVFADDACVQVDDLVDPSASGEPYRLVLHVCQENRAEALSRVMISAKALGSATVALEVFAPGEMPMLPDEAEQAKVDPLETLTAAFRGNPNFQSAEVAELPNSLWLIANPRVVQFYTDNIADKYMHSNETAQTVFADIVNTNAFAPYLIRITTLFNEPKP